MGNQPLDHGWSWVICFAAFLCILMAGLSLQVLSVLFLDLVREYQSSVTTTSLSVMMLVMSLSVSSVVSTNILVPRFDERRVVVTAGIAFSIAATLLSVAPNIVLFICLTACQGICIGCVYVPAISLCTMYFNKWRSIASTISNSGLSVALIVGPPLIRAIDSTYGLRGTILLMAGIETHMVVGGLLLRPIKCYDRNVKLERAQAPEEAKELQAKLIEDSTNRDENGELYDKTTSTSANQDEAGGGDRELSPANGRLHKDEKYVLTRDDNTN